MAELDVTKFKVGAVFYGVTETNNAFHRKKIHRNIGGEDWFRYEMPIVTYKLVTYKVLGVLRKHLEGQWEKNSDYDLLTEIFVSSTSKEDKASEYTMFIDDMDCEKYFFDKKEALVYIEKMTALAKERDRT